MPNEKSAMETPLGPVFVRITSKKLPVEFWFAVAD
jgi:hypothetical protein